MSTCLVGPRPADARQRPWRRHLGSVLLVLAALVLLGGCATGHPPGGPLSGLGMHSRPTSFRFSSGLKQSASSPALAEVAGSAGGFPGLSSSQEVLAPFLACTSPAQFIELQRGVDMPRRVEELDDWSAVRLGALGPLRAGVDVLNHKRASFLVTATREYGAARAELFALFLLHSAFTNDLHEVLVLLARDKQLGETLGKIVKPPLAWAGYERMRGQFARGLAFERFMVALLRADAALPRGMRRFLQDFERPRIETYVGVRKKGSGIRFANVLIIEEGARSGPFPRVETFSFKSRNLMPLKGNALEAQIRADASEALRYYGETLDIRRPSLELQGQDVPVRRVRLIYEGGKLKPEDLKALEAAMDRVKEDIEGVEVQFE